MMIALTLRDDRPVEHPVTQRLENALFWLMDRFELDLDHVRADQVEGLPRFVLVGREALNTTVLTVKGDGCVEVQAENPAHAAAMAELLREAVAAA